MTESLHDMTTERWARIEVVLDELLCLAPEERPSRLDVLCAGDTRLRRDVERLIRTDPRTGILDRPLTDFVGAPENPFSEGARVAHFSILDRLGEGAMGILYRARDTQLDRIVALKFLSDARTGSPEATERFLHEARTAARLDHPNICTIHEIGVLEDGRRFIAMACYEGEPLDRSLRDRRRFPREEACGLGAQTAAGLSAAHEAGIVHRDIKPSNLFLTSEGILKILDFGIAKSRGVDFTSAGAAIGTVAYMSPEQIRGEEVDGRADLWALGVVLYELLTGERPFPGGRQAAVMHAILERDPPSLCERLPDAPPRLARLIDRCLSKMPEARPARAVDVRETLEELAGAAPGPAGARAGAASWQSGARGEGALRLSPEGERRYATILVAELAGRQRLEESLSPGETSALIAECRDIMAMAIAEHRGVVNHNTGEALQALFGVPLAREDDGRRAVRTATAVVRRVRERVRAAGLADDVGMRVGVESGRVVVRDGDGETRFRIVGGPVELSGRIATQARPGEVLVGPDCRRLVAPFFQTEDAGVLPAREDEDAERLAAGRVLGETGVQTRLEGLAAEDLTEFRGRERELGQLREACAEACEGRGRLISIVGAAGLGKSRLLYEFDRRLDRDALDIVRGRCQAFGGEVPYLPFIDVLRDRLGLLALAGAESAELVADRVRSISRELEPFLPFYLQLLSLADGERNPPELSGRERVRVGLVESISALLTLASQQKPMTVLLEDWHWVDAASRQVLGQLLEMVPAYPLLLVVTARPEEALDRQATVGHTPIVLGPLTEADSEVVIRSVLGAGTIPPGVVHRLHDRTSGNPFFLEEICKALHEHGVLRVEGNEVVVAQSLDGFELPDTVQGVLNARLDRLDEGLRRLIRYASVIGREFPRDVLARALPDDADLDEGLDRLRELGLIQLIRVVPTPVYRFKHALTQDAAYDGLLERQRTAIHGAVGDALEALKPDRFDDQLDRLAEHFARAGRWEKAVEYGVAATDRLWSFSEFEKASEVQDRVIGWAGRLPDEAERFEKQVELLFRQERLLEYFGLRDRQQEIIDRLFDMLDPERHADRITELLVRQGDLYILTRHHEGAEDALEEALRICRKEGQGRLEGRVLRSLGLLRWHQRRHEDAVGFVERALELDRERDNRDGVVGNLMNLGHLHRARGDLERALACMEEALELERTMELRTGGTVVTKESLLLHVIGSIHSSMGDHLKALEYLEAARTCIASTESTRFDVVQMHFHLTAIARQYVEQGRIEDALALYRESVDLTRKLRHLEGLSTSLRMLGEVLLHLERYEEALPHLEEAAEMHERSFQRATAAAMWRGAAIACEALGDSDRGLEAWERIRTIARDLEQNDLELAAAEGVARILAKTDPPAALEAYRKALELDREGGHGRSGALRYAIGLLQWKTGALEDALEYFEWAYRDLLETGDRPDAGLALNSVGRCLLDLGRLDEARERLEASIVLNEDIGEPLLQAHALATLADVHLAEEDPGRAAERFRAALDLRESLRDEAGRGWMFEGLARAQRASGSVPGVRYYVREAREIASRTGDRELAEACDALLRAADEEG